MKEVSVSIIITARNYGKYLSEAIESALNQSVKCEVVYSDDFSTDDSLDVARKYNIKIVKQDEHVGVVRARNAGVDASTGDVLVFLDGDDILPKDFIKLHLEVFDESTPLVYCAARAFGNFNGLWTVRPWGELFLWNQNFVNTSAMMWRWAFEKAGRWKETCANTMWDWSLALRMSRLGPPRKSPATLLYRQHDDSWSVSSEGRNAALEHNSDFNKNQNAIRREIIKMSIGMIYSGRIEGFLSKWMDSLIEDVSILINKPQLIIINNSGENIDRLHKHDGYFSEIRIITGGEKIKYENERDRRRKVSELLSSCYNQILENATGELIHMREDDIIPSDGSFNKMFKFITDSNHLRNAVSGVYLNRNTPDYRIVGGFFNKKDIRKTMDLNKILTRKPTVVDFAGTGFIMFWKDICPKYSPSVSGIPAHDWAWSKKLSEDGGHVWLFTDAPCKHYKSIDEYVEYIPYSEDLDI